MPKALGAVGFLPRQAILRVHQGLLEWGQSPWLTQKQFQADRGWDTNVDPCFLLLPLLPGGRSLRGAHEGHHAADVQEEALMVAGGLLQPAEERPGEKV